MHCPKYNRNMKKCRYCGETKPLEEYYKGQGRRCKKCSVRLSVKWHANNRDKINAAERARRKVRKANGFNYNARNHGLTQEQYKQLLDMHQGMCHACGNVMEEVHIDHDHKCCNKARSCGKCVRGLLCRGCNHALGNANDDPRVLERLRLYVLEHRSDG